MAGAGRDEAWERWRRLGRRLAMPCAVVDLDALERNAKLMLARVAAPATLRLATKSLRVPALMRHLASVDGRIRGLMTFSARETAFLAERGFDDFVLAYPVA
jgi:D-serine deaminase-like pyridoxal phosphate-dependent protein